MAVSSLLTFALCAPAVATAVTVIIQPSNADTYVDQNSTGSNYGGLTTMQVRSQSGGSGRNARSLVKFDVSSIPANVVIDSATLELYATSVPTATRTYQARRVTSTWNESTVTWSSAPSVSSTVTDTDTTPASPGWMTWNITADVQAWVNGTANYGIRIHDGNENSTTTRRTDFATKENGTSANRPLLRINYRPRYTITLPSGSGVVMAEPSLLNFTITNSEPTPATERLGRVQLTFPYTVANAVPPAGWKVTDITGSTVLFDTEEANDPGCTSAALANNQSAVFGVYLTATAGTNEVTTDAITTETLGNDCNTPGTFQYYFGRSGSTPTWARRGLGGTLVATPSSGGVGDTITVKFTVTNRTTTTQNAVAPPTNLTVSGTGTVNKLSGPTPASASLATGASQEFTYTYQATGSGTVTFSGVAQNASVRTLDVT